VGQEEIEDFPPRRREEEGDIRMEGGDVSRFRKKEQNPYLQSF
jgi:hypothetical protein